MRKILLPLVLTIVGSSTGHAAESYPSKPITMVNPGPAGGAIDNVARVIAEQMAVTLRVPMLTLNLDGGGGTLATAKVAHAAPDGYTVLFHHIGVATAPALYAKLPFDTLKDLVPIGLSTEVPMVLVARNDFPPKTVKELVVYLKEQNEKVLLGTTGPGNVAELCGSMLMRTLGSNFTSIAYRGSPPALLDMRGGRIDMMCDQTSTSAAQVKAKAVKAYGVASKERLPILPDVPTLTESGLPFEFSIWQGLYAPAGTPAVVIQRLSAALQAALQVDSVKQRLALIGVSTVAVARATSESHRVLLEQEIKRWAEVYRNTPKQ
jgi:tripartite-type tricarboxylate transporter receptor subunit TctC